MKTTSGRIAFLATLLLATNLSAQVAKNNANSVPSGNDPRPFVIDFTEKAPLPVPLYVLGGKVSVVGDRIYLIGGRSKEYPDSIFTFEFDPDKNTWTRKSDVPFKHHLLRTVPLGGRIFVISEDMRKNYVYDPPTDQWKSIAPCPNSRFPGTHAVVEGKIYVFSGMVKNIFTLSDKIDVYDPATDTWSEKKPMPNPRLAATAVREGKIFLFGGLQPVKGERRTVSLDLVEAYDPKTEEWETCATLPVKCDRPVVLYGDYALLIGSPGTNEIHAYDFRSKAWRVAGCLPRATISAGAVFLKNKVYVIGGTDGAPKWTDYAYNLQGEIKYP